MKLKYRSSNLYLEPLIYNWHAWLGIMQPLSMGLELNIRILKSLRSFLKAPHQHLKYANDPKFSGGPYIDLPATDCDKVERLLLNVEKNTESYFSIAKDYLNFQKTLQNTMQGESLEAAYERVPSSIRSFVELNYDLNHNPIVRIIEPLLYKQLFDEKIQHVVISERVTDKRPFVIHTPRFETDNNIIVNLPFSSNVYDAIVNASHQSVHPEELLEKLNIPNHKHKLFNTFFRHAPDSSEHTNEYLGDSVKVRYFGHACVLFQCKGLNILTDPLLTSQTGSDRLTYSDLPEKIHFVTITHAHQDHFSIETLLNIRHKVETIIVPKNNAGSIADPSMKLILKHLGFNNIIEIEELETISIDSSIKITGIPFWGEHGDLDIRSKIGYYFDFIGKRYLMLADTKILNEKAYELALADLPEIDVIFIGMECKGAPFSWTYGPLFLNPISNAIDQTRRLAGSNASDIKKLIKIVKCKKLCIYAMGMEPWLSHILGLTYDHDSIQLNEANSLIAYCHESSLPISLLQGKSEWIQS